MPVLGPIYTGLGEIYQYTLEHPGDGTRAISIEELTHRRMVQDWVVRPLLRSISGIAEINSQGGYIKEYHVIIDPDQLQNYNITIQQVEHSIANNNANSSGGILSVDAEQYLVRGVGLIQTPQDIGNIILDEQDGVPIFVRDVGKVEMGTDERFGAIIKNGYTESVSGIVMMVRGGNAQEIISKIKTRVAEINERGLLPSGLRIVPFYDRSELINKALFSVGKVLVEGVLLVIITLLLFLGDIRSSMIVIATLIITPLVTFMVMNSQDIPANLMSLTGMTIAIGLIADSTVVVVENTFLRLGNASHTGVSRMRTIITAVTEIVVPIIFGICIIILIFLPILTLQGVEGKLFSPLALTTTIALAISLVLSLTLSPALCSYILKRKVNQDTIVVLTLRKIYLKFLNQALRNEKKTIFTAFGLFSLSVILVPFLGKAFIPELKEGTLTPQINRVESMTLDESLQMEFEAHRLILSVDGVKSVVSKLGRGESPIDPTGQNTSSPIVTLDPDTERSQDEIDQDIQRMLESLPGVQIVPTQPIAERVNKLLTINGVESPVKIKIFGDDLIVLRTLSEKVAGIIKTISGAKNINFEQLSGQRSMMIHIDRNAIARHGINVSDVNNLISVAIGGKKISHLYEGEKRFSITLRFPGQFRDHMSAINNLILYNAEGAMIPLQSVARIQITDGPVQLTRENASRRVTVSSDIAGRDLGGFVEEMQERLAAELVLPKGYYIDWGGQFKNMERTISALSISIPIAIILIFLLLYLLFNSVKLAALTLLVLPFASIGGIFSLLITGEYLSVPTSVGFIAIWGIAILNGVVLLTYIQKLCDEGTGTEEAILTGCHQRFRPVLMTATLAGFSLAPFLFVSGPGSEIEQSLAIVIIGGLITSTLLTLIVLPTLYQWLFVSLKTTPLRKNV